MIIVLTVVAVMIFRAKISYAGEVTFAIVVGRYSLVDLLREFKSLV